MFDDCGPILFINGIDEGSYNVLIPGPGFLLGFEFRLRMFWKSRLADAQLLSIKRNLPLRFSLSPLSFSIFGFDLAPLLR